MTTQAEIENVLTQHPALEPNGFADGQPDHAAMMRCGREIDICRLWLRTFAYRRLTISNAPGSYTLKHVVEKWSGTYISNGSFIMAAVLESYPIRHTIGPNALVGIKQGWYARYERESGPSKPEFDEALLG